jgi:tripartite-type tricarboxylate transporter receptor subunit TctC
MKSLLVLAFCVLMPTLANANPINVNIVWGFSPNPSVVNYTRHIIQQANQDQKKYLFQLEIKPGAAGLIAARQVLQDTENKKISMLMTTDAFFVRPFLFKNPGYSFDQFDILYQIAEVPMALVMNKNRKFDVLIKKPSVTIAMVGPGSLTHVMAEQFSRATVAKTILVGYTGPREAVKDVLGDNLDFAFDFVSSVVSDPNLKIIGITGNQSHPGLKRISDISQTYQSFNNLNLGVYYLVPAKTNHAIFSEIKTILLQAQSKNSGFITAVRSDYAKTGDTSPKFYQERIKQIENLTSGMEKLE